MLVDELGKGTEARAGTALAAALLEHLARTGARGIFATCAPGAVAQPAPCVISHSLFLTLVAHRPVRTQCKHQTPLNHCPLSPHLMLVFQRCACMHGAQCQLSCEVDVV